MLIKRLGFQTYGDCFEAMKTYTSNRTASTEDEIWLLQHPPVYTLGQAGKLIHILNPGEIPIVQSDRGGQVTYHGPGQLIGYFMITLSHYQFNVKTLVSTLENLIIQCLNDFDVDAHTHSGAPGVYVNHKKIASIGLRIKNNFCYHGIALNVDMDLSPFKGINPCGFEQLDITQVKDFLPMITLAEVEDTLEKVIVNELNYHVANI
jgi:lipoyl(octanoyl) transferase